MDTVLNVTYNKTTLRSHEFSKIQPQHINVSNLVELQIAFTTARLGRQEHVFLPKLRSVCVLDRTVERVGE